MQSTPFPGNHKLIAAYETSSAMQSLGLAPARGST
jgi:hypothetical protein